MIDFRYHLVSLISVFLALAVGIVLGAGPLREPIGTSLQSQVDALRTDRDNLRTQLEHSQHDVDQLSSFIDASAGDLLSGALTDSSVTLVRLAGSDADQADAVAGRIASAGGEVAADIQFAETAFESADQELLANLREVDTELPEDDAQAVQTALARALGGSAGPAGEEDGSGSDEGDEAGTQPTDGTDAQTSGALFDVLAEADRIGGGEWAATDAVVVIAPAEAAEEGPDAAAADGTATAAGEDPAAGTAQDEETGGDDPDSTDAETDDAGAQLAASFSRTVSGMADTVVAGSRASADHGLVAQLREDGGEFSTVDSLDLSAGPVIVPLVVAGAADGVYGNYGTTASAESILPEES